MELRQLRYFVRVAETLHFGRAAEIEHIAQSVVSTQIARLECELGTPLFTRVNRRVELTPAGRRFRRHATRVLKDVSKGVSAVRDDSRSHPTHLRIGAFTSDALMHRILEVFRERHPSIGITFVELTMVTQFKRVLNGEVDVAFVWQPIADPRLRSDPLYTDPVAAALPEWHSLAQSSSVRPEDLVDEAFAVPRAGAEDWGSLWSLDEFRGRGPRIGARVESMRETLAAIAYGGAIDTVSFNSAMASGHPGIRYVPLDGASRSTMALITSEHPDSLAVRAFRDVAHHTVREKIRMLPGAELAAV